MICKKLTIIKLIKQINITVNILLSVETINKKQFLVIILVKNIQNFTLYIIAIIKLIIILI